jgi:Tol biopolymer transport system component
VPSPDGSTLYAIGQDAGQLTIYDTSRKVFAPYLNGISALAVAFSPDRQSVAYIALWDFTLWRANADGTKPRQLTFAPWHVDAFAWSPDGRRFAIRAMPEHGRHTKIYMLPADGGVALPLEQGDLEQGSPTWSPDGTRIAFGDVPETYGQATGTECIHIYDLATRTSTDIPGSAGLWSSRWSPDGRFIAATRITDRLLMLYDTRERHWRDLQLRHVGDVAWSSDGTTMFAEPEGGAHWCLRVHVPDGRIEPLLDVADEALYFGAGVSLDGRLLFLRRQTDIYSLQLQRK